LIKRQLVDQGVRWANRAAPTQLSLSVVAARVLAMASLASTVCIGARDLPPLGRYEASA